MVSRMDARRRMRRSTRTPEDIHLTKGKRRYFPNRSLAEVKQQLQRTSPEHERQSKTLNPQFAWLAFRLSDTRP